MRLIKADDIRFSSEIIADESGSMAEFDVAYKDDIDKLPTVDAEPVVHAHWIDDSGEGDAAVCSNCGETFDTTEAECEWRKAFDLFKEFYKYCPYCGAKMDEVESDGKP